ncbi:hypothetical protein ABTY53_37080 [Streptomyces noursei]|uniref:hypothetical protein n=1 Tax=Streptomyces noursei TaxID=1971 RepID=UPI0033318E8F
MTFGIGRRLDELSGDLTNAKLAIIEAIDRSLTGLRTILDSTLTAAQNAHEAAVRAHARTDAIHSELQGIRNDTQRLQSAALPRDDQQILCQLTELRSSVEALRGDLAAAKSPEPPGPAGPPTRPAAKESPQTATSPDDFDELLTLAAGIAYAHIICHRDHWDFLVGQSSRGQHFRLPAGVKEANGLIHTEISGRTLIAALDALRTTRHDSAAAPGTQRLAEAIYQRIGIALRAVDAKTAAAHYQAGNDCPPVTRIIIDDRPAVTG